MSNIKWEAEFSYKAGIGEDAPYGGKTHSIHRIPVLEFAVKGGTIQTINFANTNNSSIMLEMEQARTFKNLSVALMLTDAFRRTQIDNPGMYWVYDLLELAARNLSFSIELLVQGRMGQSVTQAFRLLGKGVRILQPTESAKPGGSDYKVMVVRLEADDVDVVQGFHQKSQFIEEE
jgi:hypothetical protein